MKRPRDPTRPTTRPALVPVPTTPARTTTLPSIVRRGGDLPMGECGATSGLLFLAKRSFSASASKF